MAITDKKKGVWGLDQTFNKINQGSIWDYDSTVKSGFIWGRNDYGQLGLNQSSNFNLSSPAQVPGSWTLDNVSHGKNNDVFGAIKKGLTPSQL